VPAASSLCQIYLAAPRELPPDFADTLAAVIDAAPIACLRLPALPEVAALVNLAQQRNVAVLLDGNPELARRLGADGVHLADGQDYRDARQQLGADAIVGVACGRSRHAAMEAGEAGADYVAFEPDLELVAWWAETMVVPVVAELGEELNRAAEFAAAGPEFIGVGTPLWLAADGAPAAAIRLAAAIAAATKS